MATWKKVIVSGSTANLAALQVDNLTSGQVVIGGGSSNLSTTAINGTGNIVATTGATGLVASGSFSGSFAGALTGTASFATTAGQTAAALSQGSGITSFTFNGSSAQTVAVSGTVGMATNVITKWTGTAFTASTLTDNGTTITGASSIQLTGANSSLTGSFTGSFKGDGSQLSGVVATSAYALTFGEGIGLNAQGSSSYDGSKAVTVSVSGAADLTNNIVTKWDNTNNKFAVSNITDTGTQVQIGAGASSGVTVAAGGISVTGNSTFNNNLTVTGNLNVAGTASFTNTDSLFIADKFVALNSGSTTVSDSGIIVITSTTANGMSGSALYLESTTDASPNYGRWAVAANVNSTASVATADEYVVSAKIAQGSNPSAAPTWGGATQGTGNIWITNAGDIFIYA